MDEEFKAPEEKGLSLNLKALLAQSRRQIMFLCGLTQNKKQFLNSFYISHTKKFTRENSENIDKKIKIAPVTQRRLLSISRFISF